MLCAGWEAIYLEKPIITNATLTLKTYGDVALYLEDLKQLKLIIEMLAGNPGILNIHSKKAVRSKMLFIEKQKSQTITLLLIVIKKLKNLII